MGKLIPVFLAFGLNCGGMYIFRKPDHSTCFPFMSYVIFLLSMFFLLWDVPLNPYPACFRQLPLPAHLILEFVVSCLIMELVMSDFWLPLESKAVYVLPKLLDEADAILYQHGFKTAKLYEISQMLKKKEAIIASSYVLSLFFLSCIMHATRVVDFRLLQCGFAVFKEDVQRRLVKFVKGLLGMKSGCRKRSTSGSGCRSRLPTRHHHAAMCDSDVEDSSFETGETDSISSIRNHSKKIT